MSAFDELVQSRKQWLETVLRPWCRTAPLADLKKAEQEWGDLAGRPDPAATLWTWAWERFPALVYEGLTGVNETREVEVTLRSGMSCRGFPDGRRSERGQLWLVGTAAGTDSTTTEHGPFPLDQIASVEPLPLADREDEK